jgi:hypothetical protein
MDELHRPGAFAGRNKRVVCSPSLVESDPTDLGRHEFILAVRFAIGPVDFLRLRRLEFLSMIRSSVRNRARRKCGLLSTSKVPLGEHLPHTELNPPHLHNISLPEPIPRLV